MISVLSSGMDNHYYFSHNSLIKSIISTNKSSQATNDPIINIIMTYTFLLSCILLTSSLLTNVDAFTTKQQSFVMNRHVQQVDSITTTYSTFLRMSEANSKADDEPHISKMVLVECGK